MKKNRGFTSGGFTLNGFTLAEVLITLTIIGVVAALTIPSLLANVNDKTYEAKRKGFTTRMAQAVSQLDSLNSYADRDNPEENSSMNFIIEGLSKVYKITNVCEFENFTACDFPATFDTWHTAAQFYTKNFPYLKNQNPAASKDNLGIETKAAAFKTKNGESVLLYYNPKCVAEQEPNENGEKMWIKEVCAWMIFDLDGAQKGPNKEGKDIGFMSILYPDVPWVISVNPTHTAIGGTAEYSSVKSECENIDRQYGYPKGSYTLFTKEQLYTTALKRDPNDTNSYINTYYSWTSDVEGPNDSDYGWLANSLGYAIRKPRSEAGGKMCILKEDVN